MNAKLKIIILIILAVLLIGGGIGFFLYQSSKDKTEELSADEILETIVETETITTNLRTGGFVQLSFKIQTSSKKAKVELEKRDFQVKNVIIKLFSSLTEEEINSPEGTVQFEEQMKEQISKLMQEGHVVKIYTTKKMIQ
ncbi:flagellar basal body-associated FliL family protein [Pseudoneobacillus sp. C159]